MTLVLITVRGLDKKTRLRWEKDMDLPGPMDADRQGHLDVCRSRRTGDENSRILIPNEWHGICQGR
jgi:hypothetical protein